MRGGVLTSEFSLTAIIIIAIVILAMLDKASPEIIGALTGTVGVYVWSRTRVKQVNGGK